MLSKIQNVINIMNWVRGSIQITDTIFITYHRYRHNTSSMNNVTSATPTSLETFVNIRKRYKAYSMAHGIVLSSFHCAGFLGREILGWVISLSPNSGEIPLIARNRKGESWRCNAPSLVAWCWSLISRFGCYDLIGPLRNDGGWCRTIMCMKISMK